MVIVYRRRCGILTHDFEGGKYAIYYFKGIWIIYGRLCQNKFSIYRNGE